jgi:hypothetical protein
MKELLATVTMQEIVLTDSDIREKWQYYLDGTFRT